MAPDAETPRAVNAVRLLSKEKQFTIDKVIKTAYDTYLSSFETLLPPLFNAYKALGSDSLRRNLDEPVRLLREWDKRSSVDSEATTLAIFWATNLRGNIRGSNEELIKLTSNQEKTDALIKTMADLKASFGSWKVKWGEVNRYQRLTGQINETFDDNKPSIPVGLASGAFGSLPSYGTRTVRGSKKRYGTGGNSFVCVVEFGKKVKAKSIVTGGQSSDPSSEHFNDQAEMFLTGKFKEVNFYREDVIKNKEREYHPGE
jgi:acyl-homoserine lactone acylase PvdQ